MRLTRIFQPGNYQVGDEFELNETGSHHLATVLRHQIHDPCILFPGNGHDYRCTITQITKKRVHVIVQQAQQILLESPLRIHLVQAICKGDKMDWILQKATELGATSITPLISSRATAEASDPKRREKRLVHWQGILQHACEQSGRSVLPILNPSTSFETFIEQPCQATGLILSPHEAQSLKSLEPKQLFPEVTILIGPEGGWTKDELVKARTNNYRPTSLGRRILRTESAGMAMISVLQFMAGDF